MIVSLAFVEYIICAMKTENGELIRTLLQSSSAKSLNTSLNFLPVQIMSESDSCKNKSLVELPRHPMSYVLHVSLCGQEERWG